MDLTYYGENFFPYTMRTELQGSYLTVDIRYFFHEEADRTASVGNAGGSKPSVLHHALHRAARGALRHHQVIARASADRSANTRRSACSGPAVQGHHVAAQGIGQAHTRSTVPGLRPAAPPGARRSDWGTPRAIRGPSASSTPVLMSSTRNRHQPSGATLSGAPAPCRCWPRPPRSRRPGAGGLGRDVGRPHPIAHIGHGQRREALGRVRGPVQLSLGDAGTMAHVGLHRVSVLRVVGVPQPLVTDQQGPPP